MKQKITCFGFIALCLALCAVLSVGMLLIGPSQGGANELQTPVPRLRTAAGFNASYLSDLSDYLSDHFFLRHVLLTARSRVCAALGASAVDDVILGADGWLYYAPTLSDYAGLDPADAHDLACMARDLCLMQEYCEAQGMRFLFAVAPNKNSLYPEAMPAYPAAAGAHDAQRLFSALDTLGVHYADLFTVFRAQPEVLYYAHDSHWNSRGAALAADAINKGFGRDSDYFSDPFSAGAASHSGDLYQMLYPTAADPETDPLRSEALSYQRQGSETRPDSITINTDSDGHGRLFAFRDSFGNQLYPYLADSFASARFSRASAYGLAAAAAADADFVLIELVERNLGYLLQYVPVMPAPVRALSPSGNAEGEAALTAPSDAAALKGYRLLKGNLPEGQTADRIYLDCGGTAYEAFLLADGGFAAYLPAEETPQHILFETDGLCFSLTAVLS